MSPLFLIGSSFALFFAILLIKKKGKTFPDHVLATWFIVIAIHLLIYYLEYVELHLNYPHILGLTDGFAFLYGPLLFFYADSSISETPKFKRSYWVHLIPFGLYTLMYLPFYIADGSEKLLYFNEEANKSWLMTFAISLKLLSGPAYIVWVWIKLKGHAANIQHYFSYTEELDLKWLKNLTVGFALFWVIMLTALSMEHIFDYTFPPSSDALIFLALTICVVILGYFGFTQKAIFVGISVSQSDSSSSIVLKSNQQQQKDLGKYQRSGLKDEEVKRHLEALLSYMKNEKPYLSSNLTIEEVSKELDIPKHNLSQIINQELKKNFYQFVNQYRVEEAKNRILDKANQRFTLLAIGYDSGFNSKASFNTIFKSHTQMTPSQYRQSN